MAKPNKAAGVEEEEKAYATTSEVEDLKRSIEALKKAQEDSNLQTQLQMDKMMGAMANFMNSPIARELSDKQSSCQGNFRNPSVNVVPTATSLQSSSTPAVMVTTDRSPQMVTPTSAAISLNPNIPLGTFSNNPVILGETTGRQMGIDSSPGLSHYMMNPDYPYNGQQSHNLAPGAVPFWPMQWATSVTAQPQSSPSLENYLDPGGNRLHQFPENNRAQAVLKSPKLHFPEFDGTDPDGWIAKAEKYFEAARMPLEQRTDYAVTYLKERANYWWRGTGCNAAILPWHQFCRMIGDRFAETSIYDNVRMFHWLKQTGSVKAYIDQFEEIMSIVRRDNPLLPDEYYVCSFVAGLQDYVQNHLQCHRPRNLIEAIWMARRIEQSHPLKQRAYPNYNRNEMGNSRDKAKMGTYTSHKAYRNEKEGKHKGVHQGNKTGRDYGKCRKCPESWFPGHKCKMKEKQLFTIAQDDQDSENVEEEGDASGGPEDTQYITPPSSPEHQKKETVLQISMHAVQGTSSVSNTFTLTLKIGGVKATALVDSGSSATFVSPKLVTKIPCEIVNHTIIRTTPYDELVEEIKANLRKAATTAQLKGVLSSSTLPPQDVMNALFEALFHGVGKGFTKVVVKNKKYLAAAVSDEGSQMLLVKAIEAFGGKCSAEALKEVPVVLKALYDADILEEETIVQWYNEAVAGGKSSQVLKNAKPFVEWLQSADSESEEE